MSKRRIIPLPIYKADPQFYPEALFRAKQVSEPPRVSVWTCRVAVSLVHCFTFCRLTAVSPACAGTIPTDHVLLPSHHPWATKGCECLCVLVVCVNYVINVRWFIRIAHCWFTNLSKHRAGFVTTYCLSQTWLRTSSYLDKSSLEIAEYIYYASMWLHMHGLSLIKSWISGIYECCLCIAHTWSDLNNCLYWICTACEHPAVDGQSKHKPEVAMHASTSFIFAQGHQRSTLAVAIHWPSHAQVHKIGLRELFEYALWNLWYMAARKQASVDRYTHTCTLQSL